MLLNRRTLPGLTLAGLVLMLSSWAKAAVRNDIVNAAIAAGQFKTLIAAVRRAGLSDAGLTLSTPS